MTKIDFNSLIFLYNNKAESVAANSESITENNHQNYFAPELHLNIWEPENGSKDGCYLDIGLMLPTAKFTNKMILILPWSITESDMIDLSNKLTGNAELQAIFNDSYSFTNRSHDGGHIARHIFNSEKFFNIISFMHNYIKISTKDKYSYLEIDIEKLRNTSERIDEKDRERATQMYIRFRILKMPELFYCRTITPKDSIYQSSINVNQIIDVRVNVRRDIPVNLLSELNLPEMVFVSFKKIHLFLMKPQEDSITTMDRYFKSCRSLENVKYWQRYSGKKCASINSSLGYQWTYKCENPQEDDGWTVLARFTRVKFTMKRYFTFFMIAGVVGGILGNLIYNNSDTILGVVFGSTIFSSNTSTAHVNYPHFIMDHSKEER